MVAGPGAKQHLVFSLTLARTAPAGEETEHPANMMMSLPHPTSPSPSIPSLPSTPDRDHPAIPEEHISALMMYTGHCRIDITGTSCPCYRGEFDLRPGLSPETLCPVCKHPFRDHNTVPDSLIVFEAPSVSPEPAPAQLARPTKRARLLNNDFHRPFAPVLCGVQQSVVPQPTPLGFDIYQSSSKDGGAVDSRLPYYCLPYFSDFLTTPGRLFIDKTKYIEELDKAGNYSYMLLRPPRFGKSTFLSTLCKYYDIAERDSFPFLFGGLYIGNNPTDYRNSHLVLKLDLSRIRISGDMDCTERGFNYAIGEELVSFLAKYKVYLGEPEHGTVFWEDAPRSLRNVLALVKKRNHTMFVGIDGYDAPTYKSAFGGMGPRVSAIRDIFKNLFSALKEGCGRGPTHAISKYFLTGVLPAFRSELSPLTSTEIISTSARFHGICGFTADQVKSLARAYLGHNLHKQFDHIDWALQKYFDGYRFAGPSDEKLGTLSNPELVNGFLRELKEHEFVGNPGNLSLAHATIISNLIVDIGKFRISDIIRLMATGFLQSTIRDEFGYADLVAMLREDRVTALSLLVHLGVLTRDAEGGIVRIPNEMMKSQILNLTKTYIHSQEHLQAKIGPANRDLRTGSPEEFVDLLKGFIAGNVLQSLFTADQGTLQGVVEMLLDSPRSRVGELRLVMDGRNPRGPRRYGSVDIFLASGGGAAVLLELKDISLVGLLSGRCGEWIPNPPDREMESLAEEVSDMTADELDKLPFVYYPDERENPIFTTVGEMRQVSLEQVQGYARVLKMGAAKGDMDSGILDERVQMQPGCDTLHSFSLVSVGGRNLLWQSGGEVPTNLSYKCASISSG